MCPRAEEAENWRKIAEEASKETDPAKLIKLVQSLCDLLDEEKMARLTTFPESH